MFDLLTSTVHEFFLLAPTKFRQTRSHLLYIIKYITYEGAPLIKLRNTQHLCSHSKTMYLKNSRRKFLKLNVI